MPISLLSLPLTSNTEAEMALPTKVERMKTTSACSGFGVTGWSDFVMTPGPAQPAKANSASERTRCFTIFPPQENRIVARSDDELACKQCRPRPVRPGNAYRLLVPRQPDLGDACHPGRAARPRAPDRRREARESGGARRWLRPGQVAAAALSTFRPGAADRRRRRAAMRGARGTRGRARGRV